MQIDDVNGNRQLAHVGLGLTDAEANELRDTLNLLLQSGPGRHEHVSSADYKTELTIWIEPDGPPT